MNRIPFLALVAALALMSLAALPSGTALAGQTVIIDIDGETLGSVMGNSPKPDRSWDDDNDDPAKLRDLNNNTVSGILPSLLLSAVAGAIQLLVRNR
jgi:hypothetical protein